MGQKSVRGLPSLIWPRAKQETSVLVRIGRSLHWLGLGFAGFVVLVLASSLVYHASLEPVPSTELLQDLATNNPLMEIDPPKQSGPTTGNVIEALFIALSAIALGRAARYILANE